MGEEPLSLVKNYSSAPNPTQPSQTVLPQTVPTKPSAKKKWTLAARLASLFARPASVKTNASGDWTGACKAGERRTLSVNGVEFAFRYCPPGTFTMGSPVNEVKSQYDKETPCKVTLSQGFWTLETAVTQALWKAIMRTNPSCFSPSGAAADKVDGLDTLRFPVEQVSWNDCQKFIRKLNASAGGPEGWEFRLPTEAEWEYACRAGTTGPYNVDGASLDALGWYGANSVAKPNCVGQKKPNAWGLYDMHGNVWEWCADWFKPDHYDATPRTDPTGPKSGSRRVLRGGSWDCRAKCCRSSFRLGLAPTDRNNNFGFRLVLGGKLRN